MRDKSWGVRARDCDEVDGQATHRTDLSNYREVGTTGYRRRRLTRIVECGYDEATAYMREMVGGQQVTLVAPGPSTDDRDAYDRLLRYVDQGGMDAGYEQIDAGLAIARYDSRDGYGAHTREDNYVAADEATRVGYQCREPNQNPHQRNPNLQQKQNPSRSPNLRRSRGNQPGPDLDCGDVGMRVRITGTDYHWLDADGDGWGCESYG